MSRSTTMARRASRIRLGLHEQRGLRQLTTNEKHKRVIDTKTQPELLWIVTLTLPISHLLDVWGQQIDQFLVCSSKFGC